MSLKNSKIIVIKIGSSLLVDENKRIRKKWLTSFAKDIKKLKSMNKKVVIVSSGAIALGQKYLKINKIHLIGFSLGSLIALDFVTKMQNKVDKLILIGTTYKRTIEERSLVIDRYNQAKLNKPLSKQALKRWFSDKYLEDNPKTYDLFMKILNKEPEDHKNFLKAYELFANHYDDFEAIKKIDRKTLVMTGSDDVGSTPAMSKELVKDLVNSTYIEIKNGKHLCSIECADDVNMNIKNFINN